MQGSVCFTNPSRSGRDTVQSHSYADDTPSHLSVRPPCEPLLNLTGRDFLFLTHHAEHVWERTRQTLLRDRDVLFLLGVCVSVCV